MTETQWQVCTRCGGEAPPGFVTYTATVVPATKPVYERQKAMELVRKVKSGLCYRCATDIKAFIEGAE